MALTDTLKGAWSGDGKKWVIGGAILGAGYLWWTRVRTAKAAPQPGDATITSAGTAVAAPITPPGGDYSPASSTTRPATNGEWLSQVVAILIAAPYNRPAIATWNALSKALSGDPLTTAEAAIVEQAIQVKGTPPEGMPPLNMSGGTTGTDSTPPTGPQTPEIPAEITVVKGAIVDDWVNDMTRKYGLYWGNLVLLNPTLPGNVSKSMDPRKRVFLAPATYRLK
jgi:hypothetical protein